MSCHASCKYIIHAMLAYYQCESTPEVSAFALSCHDVAGVHRVVVIILCKVFCCVCSPFAFVLMCSYFNIVTSLSMLSSWCSSISRLTCPKFPHVLVRSRERRLSSHISLKCGVVTVGSSLSLLFLWLLRLTNLFDVFRPNDVA